MICAEKLKWKNRADINFDVSSVSVYKKKEEDRCFELL